MANIYPFYVFQRPNSPYYYVAFKLDEGGYTKAKSTRETTKKNAIKKAFEMMSEGTHDKSKSEVKSLKAQAILKDSSISNEDLLNIVELLKKRNLVSNIVLKGASSDINLNGYVQDFWTYDKSAYVKDKLRQGHTIHKTHCNNMLKMYNKYLFEKLKDKLIGSMAKKDIKAVISYLTDLDLSGHSKNVILRSLLVPLKYAYNNDVIDTDLNKGVIFFSEVYKKREILTPELAQAIFSVEWNDERARLANIIAMCTGMRQGEIRALQIKDIGADCLYVNHSWSDTEGLKTTKTNDTRVVYFPFPNVLGDLRRLYWSSPFCEGKNQYIFYASIPNKPIDADIIVDGLRNALVKAGVSSVNAKSYCFHAWRHFFTTYMSERLTDKQVQSQTGHKTRAMLEHYSSHMIDTDKQEIISASKELFTRFLD